MMDVIVKTVLHFYPDIEAIYLFGSAKTDDEWPESDVDIALLFPHYQAKLIENLPFSECNTALTNILKKEIDLINLRLVSMVFQFQIITTGRLIYTGSENAISEYEMLTISSYQKLNEERQDILQEFYSTKRAYPV
jgi:uncharacterized protein